MHQLEHRPDENRFIIQTENGLAELNYHRSNERVDFTRTFVEPADRGSGIAKRLVDEGIRWAREQGLGIDASCWYVKRVLSDEA